jgi:ElaB/YqjD/DUF883 family membrane-anchored ribosome-binding protein
MNSGYDSEHGGTASARSTDQGDSRTRGIGAAAGEAVSKLGEATQQAGRQAKEAATSLASEANQKVKGLMNEQVGAGADLVGHVAASVRQAADSLDRNVPQLAGFVRDAADRIEDFSSDIRDKSVDELYRLASDFARRQPAVVFGTAAAAGFLVFRLLKGSTSGASYGPSATHQRFGDDRWQDDWRPGDQWRSGGMSGGHQDSTVRQNKAGQFHGV